jgi:Bacterial Ig-like domain (group 3)
VPTGTPAKLRVTLTLDCACAGGAINQPLSEAKIEEFFVGNFVSSTGIANKINPGFVQVFNHDVLTGETFRVIAKLHLQSGASNDTVSTAAGSRGIASAQVYIDVLSGNASVTGDSGHLYATPVVTGTTAQSLTFAALTGKALGDAPFNVSATASSGLPVSVSSQTGSVCTVAGVSVTLIASGTCTIRVSQAGNGTFAPAADVDQSFAVSASSSAVSITNSPAQPITGQAITFAVTVTGSSPGGSVTFTDNGGTIGTASVTNGTASLTVPSLSQGNHSIVAQYSGDANNLAANSAPLGFTVQAAPTPSSSSGGGGCTIGIARGGMDPMLLLIVLIALCWIVIRRRYAPRN